MSASSDKSPQAPVCVYYCGHEQCRSGHRFGPASRNHHLLHFVARGSGTLKNTYGEFGISAGNGFYIAPGETTVYGTGMYDPWEYCWIGFGGTDARRLLSLAGISSANPVFRCDYGAVKGITDRLAGKRECSPDVQLSAIGDVYALFSLLCSLNSRRETRSCDGDYVHRALAYMREIAYYDIKIEQIASYVGLNRSHLYRLVQAQTGISLKEHLIRFRIDRASELLKGTDLEISQIAYSCGFNDANHFSRLFRSRTGMSPSQFRALRTENEGIDIYTPAGP